MMIKRYMTLLNVLRIMQQYVTEILCLCPKIKKLGNVSC